MNKEKTTINAFTVPQGAVQQMQNVLLIWLDGNIDETNDDCQNTIKRLRCAVEDIKTYTNGDQCLEFIETVVDKKVCMIMPGYLGHRIVLRLHNMSQLDSIFIFCGNKTLHEQWAKDWPKIKGVFTDITPICEALKEDADRCEQKAIPVSFMRPNEKLDQLDPSFMYTQIIKEILLTIKFGQNHIQDYINYCRVVFAENELEIENIERLQSEYHNKTPIYWYSYPMFLYPMMNRALRSMDGDIITRMGFFICDLHRQIEQMHKEQYGGATAADPFTVYRGQGLSTADFEKMTTNIGGLISFNSFLSTSIVRGISEEFVQAAITNPDQVRVLFIMEVNPAESTTPFASIAGLSELPREQELLFSMHSVFHIQDIKQMDENNRLYEVNLVLTADNDPKLKRLTDYIRQESFPNDEGWYRLGLVLWKMGLFDKAEDIYQVLLDQTTNHKDKAPIYHRLGTIKYDQGNYREALSSYQKALEIWQQSPTPNYPDLASSYNNIGLVHINMGNYSKALSSYEKAVEIQQQSLTANHPDLASSYNNIGEVHRNMGDYPKALSSLEKALEIKQQSIPSNHPDLANSYNNIASVRYNMGNYPKALSYYEKALEIRQQSLPSNHPDLASSYNNIGLVHLHMGDYPKALSFHEKALEIKQQSLPPNHPHFAPSYNNIGEVYAKMGNYPKALSYYEKDLEISKESLPPYHPDLAISYNDIGEVHAKMGNYSKALSSYEKAVEIQQQSLTTNHPDLASSYNNIGEVHRNMGDYPKALSSHEKALKIQEQSLPFNHPDLAKSYNNIGSVYYNLGNYSKALSYYEKAAEIQQQSLSLNHPDLAYSYNNIGEVHYSMDNYPKACTFYEYAIQIAQQSLPSDHPNIQKYRSNLEDVKNKQ
ncbi:unnamed protein product [Adineta steineri]|uniref:ADP ribosyltransferase domain-containing protein n=1 Tax=Adineta steineri TaxID=433720 RepID=A0A814EU39_9BILA|nr:unnamed protein product [Adineta steineri]CAF3780825.1 unnamed protein product [Adineta steineri]